MAQYFPISPKNGDARVISGKRYVYDGEKWDLQPLLDRYQAEKPVVFTELPVVDNNNETIEGVGRTIDHSFTIKELDKLETI